MAGIYIHIPFCKQACHYCNFHFSTTMGLKKSFITALIKEIALQKDYLKNELVETIYFGGGTPSLLENEVVVNILETISQYHNINLKEAEVTLEANPDDLTLSKLKGLYKAGVNRLSIGVQSFHDMDLELMNRSHNGREALSCIENALAVGFSQLSLDLIFGNTTTTDAMWAKNLETIDKYQIPHLSCYSLTIEEKTAMANMIKKQMTPAPEDSTAARHFQMAVDYLADKGYAHYEISNYAKAEGYSKHNTNYWRQVPYLGLGPSAHSFDGITRQWNVAHNKQYIDQISTDQIPATKETLTTSDLYNEYVMTGMRTMWGCTTEVITERFPDQAATFKQEIEKLIQKDLVTEKDKSYVLASEGKFIADHVISQLFYTE